MLSEQKILKSVELINSDMGKVANVLWLNQILRDEEVISSTNHRKSYSKVEKDHFIEEVENGVDYIKLLQWEDEVIADGI